MDSEKNKKLYAKIVAKAWTDDAFKADLFRDPGKAVRDIGMDLPPDAIVEVVADGKGFDVDTSGPKSKLTLTVPARPANLTDEAIVSQTSGEFIPCEGIASSGST